MERKTQNVTVTKYVQLSLDGKKAQRALYTSGREHDSVRYIREYVVEHSMTIVDDDGDVDDDEDEQRK